ncbi:E3 ubiquitin-protein ligase MYCBP2 isoform X10 [Oncorhynchus kisutch]|uniref:E3 ubiquitin-protein ligase MYCBP2 isoform X10 n=1 Tax=Oncorhynchus kisutch TaxID=8019 RepID=UPI0012DF2BD0|nr:E3 ubiquitin-protein ligase MYCBP2 isoform X10 [Oncorhynchus kisutch]
MMCAAAAAGGGILPSTSPSMRIGIRVISGVGDDFSSIGSGMGSCQTPGTQSDCRSRYQLLLSGRALAERYRRIYTTAINDKEQGINQGRGKKTLSKKKLKRRQKVKSKVKTRTKTDNLDGAFCVPDIKLHSNPSAFNVYCNVRHCVLDWQQRESSLASQSSVQSGDSDSEEEEEYREPAIKLPKIIGIGLCGVFELIKETRFSHPSLCLRSLQALLHMLQGQQPEGFQTEPPDVLESLFQLLLETTVRSTGMNDPTGQALTALSCACLFSLVVSWGDTGKTLQAVSAILTNNGSHACQTIQVPTILNALQRSVQAVLVGKIQIQDWFGNGIKRVALMNKWVLKEVTIDEDERCLLQTDGSFLYLLCKDGLYKVGSGYSGTVRGHVYNSTSRIRNRKEKRSWLGFAQGCLLYRDMSNNHSTSAIKINPETLEHEGTITMPGLQADGQNIVFTDGEYINQIAACKDDGFVVRIYATSTDPALQQELQLKLARKCLHACGISLFDLEKDLHIISTGFDEEAALLGAGREFALMKTASGKVYYTGKYQSLGIKQGGPLAGKWVELPITKSPKIVQFSVGHDGSHALLVAEDGSVFFTGSASKGEDGESTKSRRQPKPYKPKKMMKLETKTAVNTACNNGSSSIVTKDGELYMFGKDAIYSDSTCQVSDLKGHIVTQVAMGKAHTCVLTKSGEVWTFGVNNKGQCGRETGAMNQAGKAFGVESMATAMDEDLEDELEEKEEKSMMCQPGMHKWKLDQCMVCTVCGDCTGYGASCVSSGRPDRVPGGICGCGSGESGCSACGCCKACARELDGQEVRQRGIFDAVKEMIPLDLLLAVPVPPPPGVNIEEHIQIRQEEKRQRINRRHRLEEGRGPIVFPGPILMNQREQALVRLRPLRHKRDKHTDGNSERGEKDASKITTYPPGAVRFDCEMRAVQVSCGFHHSVVLMENGDVYTFGYGQHGQLGHGDVNSRGSPTLVQALPGPSVQVTAGSNHTAVLLMDGQVFTFGSFSKGQLGRPILDMPYWNAKPSPMPNIGAKYGRKATWIGASGDQTFLRIDEALINSHVLATSEIFASKHIIGLVPTSVSEPPPFKCLLINKLDGSCRTFNDSEQEDLQGFGLCLDPVYDVIWRFLPASREMWCYNAVIADARVPSATDLQASCSILSPELALPAGSHTTTTRSHGALHILGCLDTLATMQELKMGVTSTEEETQAVMKVYSKEDYSVVNRFESHGGGWGYSAHSVEAIRFCADADILLGGLGLFGGRGEYTAKIKLFELGPDGGDHETDGDLMAETDVLAYDCAAREKYAMMFDEPVLLQLGWWYVAWARVSGPSSDCGSHGQATITTDDSVVFQFKSSKKSNNGTDVNAGQIPQLLYRLPSNDGNAAKGKQQTSEPVHILKRSFARTVSVECFESLLRILHWSWTTLVLGVEELRGLKGFQYTATLLDLERLRFVGTCCLRLLRVYICEIFPISASTKAVVEESSKLAECVGKTRSLLKKILSEGMDNCLTKLDNDPQGYLSQPLTLLEAVLQECHNTFTACFHSFYPTPALQWACLCDLLNCLDQDIAEANFRTSSSRLLAAVMSALCNTSVKLTSILPIAYDGEVLLRSLVKQVSTENDSALAHRFPLLVAHMEKLSHTEENLMGMTSFREVLEKMLVIVVLPVRKSLRKEVELFSPHLVSNTCGLLASIVSELTASALGSEVDGLNSLHSVKSTPNRFTKMSQGRSWNTGNGSPDAICLTVDKPGVVLVGFCVYGGGGIHEYELEVLADDAQTEHPGDSAHTHRWTSLELVKGTYSTDDSPSDIAEIRLDKAVPLKEGVKYAVRLRNYGSRTANGDGGMTTVQCSDGMAFTFSTCSLSSNGTNQTRGQIPQILYYRSEYDGDLQSQLLSKANEEDKNCSRALSVVSAVVRAAKDLLHRAFAVDAEDIPELLSSSSLFSMLLPLILAYIGPVATSVPKAAVEVFGLVQELLPAASALNQKYAPPAFNPNQSTDSTTGNQPEQGLSACTTSSHYAVIESDHPYKQAGVAQYKVSFPDCVRWTTIEFDPQCGTAQPEDVLRLLIPSRSIHLSSLGTKPLAHDTINTWVELKKISGSNGWPTTVLVLPGNEALFSLETASDYVKDEKACFYGFKCVAVGYEFNPGPDEGIIQLEKELAYLGSVCAAALMKKDLALPIGNELEEDLEILEEASLQVCKAHSGILGKGLVLSHSPTILEALEGNLPLHLQTNEHSFLEDFITCVQNSSGGRLARWLQPDSYADPQKTSLILNKDDIRCSWPTTVAVQTKDQYGDIVHVPNMKVEVKAVPVSQKKSMQQECMRKLQRLPGSTNPSFSGTADLTFGGLPMPKLEATYEPMIVKEARYIAITMMKAYENYSFEELRFASPTPKRPSENMLIRANTDGTYSANWTPGAVGLYTIHVTIDGIEIGNVEQDAGLEVEVKDPPKGMIPPGTQMVKPKAEPQPSKVRKFVSKDSAGLRVRSHPSLQSEQIGIVQVNGTITFIDEIHNDDGVWLRLNDETVKKYVPNMNGYTEAWCLSFNQHVGRSLLVPANEAGGQSEQSVKEVSSSGRPSQEAPSMQEQDRVGQGGGPGLYKVVKTGPSGHNIRSCPNLRGIPIGMLVLGNTVKAVGEVVNTEGTWVQLDKNSVVEFCESDEGEAWSLARDRGGNQYLRHEEEQTLLEHGAQTPPPSPFSVQAFNRATAANGAQGFDYGISNNKGDQRLTAILNSAIQSGPFLPPAAPPSSSSVFEQAAQPPSSSLVHSPFVFGQCPRSQVSQPQPQLPNGSSSRSLASSHERVHKSSASAAGHGSALSSLALRQKGNLGARPMSPATKQRLESRSPKQEGCGGRASEQSKSKDPPASEALILRSDTAKLRSDSHSRSHSPNHNTLQALKADGRDRNSSGLRAESPNHGSRSTSPKQKGLSSTSGRSSPSSTSSPRSSTQHDKNFAQDKNQPIDKNMPQDKNQPIDKNMPQDKNQPHDQNLPANVSPSKARLDPPRERSKSDSYTLDPDTLRKKVPLTSEPLRGRSTSPKPKLPPKDGSSKGGDRNAENRTPSPHVTQENLHSEVVEVCTSSALLSNDDEGNNENVEVRNAEEGSSKVHFSIGKAPVKEELESSRLSPKVSRKTSSRHVRPKKDKSGPLFKGESSSRVTEPAKQAMSPSVAECARAVFAAFLWHEGIVHDAMACSSFLKFNPERTKEHAPIRSSLGGQGSQEEKESKLKNRHSLEISSALNMFNISPHGPDISKMGSINKNKVLSMLKEPPLPEKCEDGKGEHVSFEVATHPTMRAKSILPLTLQHLVAFWEDISMATIKAATQNMIFPSPGSSAILKKKENEKDTKKSKKEKKKRDKAEVRPRGNLFGEMAQLAMGGPEKDTICELCGESHPYPVTYHMRQAHPGCGRYAGGQGYNSIGHFCGGWAGNCGDGGIGGSTWYLVCDRCREKYLREKQTAAREKVKQSRKKPLQVKTPRALPTMEAHQVIRANALFLLSLSSAAEPSLLCHHPHRPLHSTLPSLKEGVSDEIPNKIGCLYLQTLARQHTENFGGYTDDNLYQDEMRYLRSTSVPAPYISVTPDACPNVFEEPESNMKSMPPSLETSPITDSDLSKRTVFQRSYSVVASEYDKQHSASPARVKAVPRRRVHSGDAEVGSSLLRHPSPELSRLISAHGSLSKGERNFQWPVLAFVIQHHDLEGLEVAMKHALRKSACRVFAMEAFNWLLCNVIQTTSLHDILWHFVASLTPSPFEPEEEEEDENKAHGNKEIVIEQERDFGVCEHPLSDIVIAGEAAHPLPHTFHRLLQTISDLMMSLPSGSSLQQMALRCWSLKFKQSDHQFLHQSNVFHHINNILSKSDDGDSEESFNISVQSGYEAMSQLGGVEHHLTFQELCLVTSLKDLTILVDIKTSSRPAMIGSLTDGSTETFWESGDEDKNKTKSITISCVKGINASYVTVHVDNSRDIGNKVTSVTFLCGKAVEDLCRIKQIDLDSRHMGWVTSEVPGGDHHVIKVELKGPENTLRVRQVKVLGWKEGESIKIAGQISASVAQQKNCEAETLRVFRLITSQVFGKLICGDAEPTPEQEEKNLLSSPEGEDKAPSDADLKEHMVGIIFSRSKLTNLQKQVCAHIVQAIRMEATRVREEWEHAISSKENANSQPSDDDASSDAYCFELLSMVLALSGSNVGRQYLAQQLTLMQDLFSLLHTASPRVQRQVTSLLRRVLPEVTPVRLASIIGVKALPPADISDIIHSTEKGDWNKLGILDMFLGCIAKALTVQLKAKGTTISGTAGMAAGKGVTTVTLPMIFNSSYIRRGESHWWMKGSTPPQIAEIIIKLVKDMAAGHLSDAWSRVTKNAIAETIIALTKMEEEHRSPVRCIATTRLWLALASLCVLDQDHVDRLSSGRWMGKDGQQKQMPMCDNHDDSETAAIILCNMCGNLCTDCDRFLHLHRRTRSHQRQVFKEEEEAIKVDLHEGCGRTKLFWLMALADSKTMKAMVEFREHTGKPASSSSDACRFCGTRNGTELSAVGSVCSDPDCQEYAKLACSKTHACGHPCGGVKNEESCLPCLHGCDKSTGCLKQDADDMCMICFTEALSAAPAVQLDCSHVFHLQCTRRVLDNRWLGPRITFGFMSCPICKNKINHSVIKDLLDPIKELFEDVRRKALMRMEYEGLHKSEAITTPGARFHNDPAGFAMNRYAYYVCYKCKKAYFGGEARCDAEAGQGDDYDPSELICGACSDVSRAQMCSKHGTDFLEYKCRYCCSVAVFFCFGTTHFCNACHDDFQKMTSVPKEELPHCPAGPKGKQLEGTECPLHVVHPPTGEEFALGCGVCRNAHTF